MNQWLQDLELLLTTIEQTHPAMYHRNGPEIWENVVDQVRQLLATGKAVALAGFYKIVALLADGHSRVNLQFTDHRRQRSTCRFDDFKDIRTLSRLAVDNAVQQVLD